MVGSRVVGSRVLGSLGVGEPMSTPSWGRCSGEGRRCHNKWRFCEHELFVSERSAAKYANEVWWKKKFKTVKCSSITTNHSKEVTHYHLFPHDPLPLLHSPYPLLIPPPPSPPLLPLCLPTHPRTPDHSPHPHRWSLWSPTRATEEDAHQG